MCDTLGKAKYSGDYGGEGNYASTMDGKQIARSDHDSFLMQKCMAERVGRLIYGRHCGSIV